jgi:hypothetical protein
VTRGVPGLPEVAEVLSGFLPEIGVFAYAREKVQSGFSLPLLGVFIDHMHEAMRIVGVAYDLEQIL